MSTNQVIIKRGTKRALNEELAKQQLQASIINALKSGRGTGWTYKLGKLTKTGESGNWVYETIVSLSCEKEAHLNKFETILSKLADNFASGPLQSSPWIISNYDGYKDVAIKAVEKHEKQQTRNKQANEDKELGEVNLIIDGQFDHIFSREAHIRRVYDVLKLGVDTEWQERNHCLLWGSPGCGKSEILLSFAKLLGEEDVAYTKFDATSMTKAGVLENLLENPFVPPVLIIEEIEKCEETALRWLLGVMDSRGEIRRTNYRVGTQAKNVKMVVLASANDLQILESMMSGALYSRFTNKIYCDKPNRETLTKILERKIQRIPNSNHQWIEKTLEFGFDQLHLSDPRDLISICICGRDRLLDGSFQDDYIETTKKKTERL